MSNNITTLKRPSISPPAPQSRDLSDLIGFHANKLVETAPGRFSISTRSAPAPAAKAALQGRKSELTNSLAASASDREAMAAEIGSMLAVFPQGRPDAMQARMIVAAYVETLAGMPLWAIQQARKGMIARATPFAPSAGEMLECCGKIVSPLREELAQINRILDAVVEDRQQASPNSVKAMAEAFKAGVSQEQPRGQRWRPPTKAEAESALATPPAHLTGPVSVSPELEAKLAEITAFAREVL
jgi:hypothetical protein